MHVLINPIFYSFHCIWCCWTFTGWKTAKIYEMLWYKVLKAESTLMLKYIHTLNLNLLCSMFIHFMHILYSHYYEMQFECFDHFVISSAMLILPSQDTLLNKNSWPNWQYICRFTIGPCIYSHFLTLIINFLFWPIRKSVLNRNT